MGLFSSRLGYVDLMHGCLLRYLSLVGCLVAWLAGCLAACLANYPPTAAWTSSGTRLKHWIAREYTESAQHHPPASTSVGKSFPRYILPSPSPSYTNHTLADLPSMISTVAGIAGKMFCGVEMYIFCDDCYAVLCCG